MIDFAYKQLLLFLPLLARGHVLAGPDNADASARRPDALEIALSERHDPADLAVSFPQPEQGHGALGIDGIKGVRDCL
jgi:hypothetical protein